MIKKTLGIVAECDRKVWDDETKSGPWLASEVFCSAYFTSNLAFARRFCSSVRILSSRYGLIEETFEIAEPYSSRMNRAKDRILAAAIQAQIRVQKLHTVHDVLGLGGFKFATLVSQGFSDCPATRLHFPFTGMPIGEQQKIISKSLWNGKLPIELEGKL